MLRWVPSRVRFELRLIQSSLQRAPSVCRRLGWRTAFAFVLAEPWLALRSALRLTGRNSYRIRMPHAPPVVCRPDSSDLDVFFQVLGDGQYRLARALEGPARVLDCGANIGTATLAILRRWPNATIVAVEPDADNLRLLIENTRHAGDQVIAVQGLSGPFPAGWSSIGVHSGTADSGACTSERRGPMKCLTFRYDVPGLMRRVGWDRVDLLKMDIEGAETPVLESAGQWLSGVACLAVELHDENAVAAFRRTVGDSFRVGLQGELTIARRGDADIGTTW